MMIRKPSFDHALRTQATLSDAMTALTRESQARFDKALMTWVVRSAAELWDELMGAGDERSAVASSARYAIPLKHVSTLADSGLAPAALFVVFFVRVSTSSLTGIPTQAQLDVLMERVVKDWEVARNSANTIQEGLGCDRSDSWGIGRTVQDQSGRLSPFMAQVLKLAGRMFDAFAHHGVTRPTADRDEYDGVELGDDLERVLDEEAASFGVDVDALARFADGRATQHKTIGERPHKTGPLVVALDESGSMNGPREVWSKACAIALARLAMAEGRKVRVVFFSMFTDTVTFEHFDGAVLRRIANTHASGGTCIETAIRVAVDESLALEAEGCEGADIVFITDGEAPYGTTNLERMRKHGVRLWTVAIDCDIEEMAKRQDRHLGAGGLSTGWLFTYASAYVHINDAALASNNASALAVKLKGAALERS